MITEHEPDIFIKFRKFNDSSDESGVDGVYEFKRGERYFFVDKEGLRMRLQRLVDLGKPHDETSKALSES